ncbi:MAG: DUF3500 domain-containing protein [Luteolibacter sp.]
MKTFLLLILLTTCVTFAQAGEEKVATEMATAATAFLTSLDKTQITKAHIPFVSEERENWGYVPRARNGLPLSELTAPQHALVNDLLKSALSETGLHKTNTIIALEALLREIEKRPALRDPGAYFTTIFGNPAPTGTWGWRFEGHHISLNYTIVDGKPASLTPSFFAANPAEVTTPGNLKGTRLLAAEEDLARALAITLMENGKEIIYSEKPPREILTGQKRKATQLKPVGVPASEMTPAQQQALFTLIAEFAERHRKELSNATMEKIKADLGNLRFAWTGSLEPKKPFYYRIQSTTFLVEVANVQNSGNHIHAVWRDTENDFAHDVLADHIKIEH